MYLIKHKPSQNTKIHNTAKRMKVICCHFCSKKKSHLRPSQAVFVDLSKTDAYAPLFQQWNNLENWFSSDKDTAMSLRSTFWDMVIICACSQNNNSYHISSDVEYSVLPSSTSGGRYHSVTTSWEYVWQGTDLARASPGSTIITQRWTVDDFKPVDWNHVAHQTN